MSDLISREALKRWLEMNKANANPLDYNTKATYAECITMVEAMETIDAVPVRHAKVLYNVAIEKEECCGYKKRKGLVLQKYTCSSCYTAIPGESKFCMECGAKLIWRDEDD